MMIIKKDMQFYTAEERKQPYRHISHYSIDLYCPHIDLSKPIEITKHPDCTDAELAEVVTMFISKWMINVYPRLNGFRGFDTVEYIIK